MNKNNIVVSTSYLELINNIDSLIYELLFDENSGYTNLNSKDAVLSASKILDKFDWEVTKLTKENNFTSLKDVIKEKRNELISFIKNYYDKELENWSSEVFEKLLDNLLFSVCINKNNPEKIKEISYKAYCAINWQAEIQYFSKDKKEKLIANFNSKLEKAYLSKDEDFIPKINPEKTDINLFLKTRDDFIKKDLSEIEIKNQNLTKEDASYFLRLINDFKSYKKFEARDEILLVNSAISIMKLKTNEEKYDFIKEVDGDITVFLAKNKRIDEKDKIELIKRRIKLFEESFGKNTTNSYFKKLLTVS